MEAGADAQPVERSLALEPLADEPEDGHLALGPLDPPDALGGQAEVGHVVGRQVGHGGHRCGGLLGGGQEAAKRAGQAGPRRPESVGEPLLEADVLLVAEPAIRLQRRRIIGPDVQDDFIARPEQIGGDRAGRGRREPAAAELLWVRTLPTTARRASWLITWVPAAATSRPPTRIP